jgi:hypothetical protein
MPDRNSADAISAQGTSPLQGERPGEGAIPAAKRDANLAIGCAVAIALLVAMALVIYLWTA